MNAGERTAILVPGRRVLAAGVDLLCAGVLSGLLASTLGAWCAERAVMLLQIGQPESLWRGPAPLVLGVLGNLVYAFPVCLLLVLLPETFAPGSAGKLLLRLSITAAPDTSPPRARLVRFTLKCAPALVWCVALLWPHPAMAVIFALTLLLTAVSPLPLLWHRAPLHDRLARTTVTHHPSH